MNPSYLQELAEREAEKLNEQQGKAVRLPSQSALIVAGAGSGKTRVLTTRVAWLMGIEKIPSHAILAVTFTNKAAKEMMGRLRTIGLPIQELWVGTFHGLANRLLRTHHEQAGLPKSFSILDQSEQLTFLKRVMRANELDPKLHGADKIQDFINHKKEQGLRAKSVGKASMEGRVYALYEAAMNRDGVVDFAELLLRCHELLRDHPDTCEHYQQRFQHILVDEFQDTNRLQYEWLKKLAGGGAAVFAVGDQDQSIYRFRGAEPENLKDFINDFSPVAMVKLEQNYRSHGNILKAANAVIDKNPGRLKKNLWTGRGDGEPILTTTRYNDINEAEWVADRLQEYRRQGIHWKEMAILYRTNAQSRNFEKILTARAIPFIMYGGFRFFDRLEIKHTMAYLRLLHNPHDNIAFWRVSNMPSRAIGETSMKKLELLSHQKGCSLWDAMAYMTGKAAVHLKSFKDTIIDMQQTLGHKKLPQQVEGVIISSGLEAMYKAEKSEGVERLDNLYELISAATIFIQENPQAGVDDFFANSVLDSDVPTEKRDENADQVRLMTVHSSKGLEFGIVFIVGAEETLFPHANAMGDEDALHEERRLMYVAITRAKEKLHISRCEERMIHGQKGRLPASRFIREIPKDHIKDWRYNR